MAVPVAAFAMVCVLVWLDLRAQQARTQTQRDIQLALLQKFSSADELTRFLADGYGKQFLEKFMADPSMPDPRRKVVDQITSAIVLIAVGAGLFLIGTTVRVFLIPAIICLAVGVGLLLAAGVSHRLGRKMGLIQ